MTAKVNAPETHAPIPDLDSFDVYPTVGDDDLDSFSTIDAFGVLIRTDKLDPDDMIYVETIGEPGTPEGGKSKSWPVRLGSSNPRRVNLGNDAVAFLLGKKMWMTYTILRKDEIEKTSDPRILNVLPLPREELKAARIPQAQDNGHGPELDLTSNTAECTVYLGGWPLWAKNQRCWVDLEGKNAGGGDHPYSVMESEPVDDDWLDQGYREVKVPYDYFKALLNGSLLKVFVEVALNKEDDRTQAFPFEERIYTVKNVEVAKPEITTVIDLKGVEISNPGTTKYTTVKLKGRAEPNQLLEIFDGESIVGNPTANEQGDWEHRLERLSESDHKIFVEGPKGLTSDVWKFRVEELQAPTIDTVKDSKGEPVGEGETTLDGDLKLEGKAEDGYEVEIFDRKTSVALLRVYDGIWELRKTFSNREHVLKAVGRYGDDRPAESAPRSFTVAVQASKPTIEKVTDSNGKPVPHGSKTRDTRVKLEGTALPYQELKVFDGEQHIDSVTTGKDGVWLCELIDLSQSEHPIRVEVRPGVDSGVWIFTVVELVQPTINEVKDVAGTTIGDTVTTNKTPLTLTGTVDDGQKVDIFDGASKLGQATITEPGNWEFKTSVLSSLREYRFKAVEQGVGGTESATRTVTVTAAVNPAINEVKDVAGTTIGDTVTTNKTPLKLTGTVADDQKVDIFDGASKLGQATITEPGNWEFKTSVLSSLREYRFKAVEQGVGGTESATRTVTVTAAVKPTINEVRDVAGTTIGDTVTTNKTPLKLTGTVADDQKVDIFDGASKLGQATITEPGKWEFETSVLSSLREYRFKAVEQGVGGTESATRTVTVTAAVKPTINEVRDVAGTTIGDTVTTNKTPLKLTGTVADDQKVDIFDGASKLGQATITEPGKWEFETSVLSSLREYRFKAVEQGVGGTESATRTVTVTAAVNPAINEVWDNKGFLLGDTGTTSETPLMLKGTVATGKNVDIYYGAIKQKAATITAPGKWEFKTTVLSRETYELIAVEQGVGGTRSATYTITVRSGENPKITKMTYTNGGRPIFDGDIITDGRVEVTVKITPGKQGKIVSAMVSDGPFSVNGVGEETRSITLGKGTHYIRVLEIPAGLDSPVVTLTVT